MIIFLSLYFVAGLSLRYVPNPIHVPEFLAVPRDYSYSKIPFKFTQVKNERNILQFSNLNNFILVETAFVLPPFY